MKQSKVFRLHLTEK